VSNKILTFVTKMRSLTDESNARATCDRIINGLRHGWIDVSLWEKTPPSAWPVTNLHAIGRHKANCWQILCDKHLDLCEGFCPRKRQKTPTLPTSPTPTHMTLLDYFAGQAMQSLIRIGAEQVHEQRTDGKPFFCPIDALYFGSPLDGTYGSEPDVMSGEQCLASDAYHIAEAMIIEKHRRESQSKEGTKQ
jgi:hypothetical protein